MDKKVVKNGTVVLSISENLDTIICPECGNEVVIIAVLRGEEHVQLMQQGFFDYCPNCGKKMDHKAWLHAKD